MISIYEPDDLALCGATVAIDISLTSLGNLLIINRIAAPVIAGMVSLIYFRRFSYTNPLETSVLFLAFVVLVDFVAGPLIKRSLEMFGSVPETWSTKLPLE